MNAGAEARFERASPATAGVINNDVTGELPSHIALHTFIVGFSAKSFITIFITSHPHSTNERAIPSVRSVIFVEIAEITDPVKKALILSVISFSTSSFV